MRLKSGDVAPKTCTCNVCNSRGIKIATVAIKKGQRLKKLDSIHYYYDIAD